MVYKLLEKHLKEFTISKDEGDKYHDKLNEIYYSQNRANYYVSPLTKRSVFENSGNID